MPGFLNWIRSTLRGEVSASELYARRGAGTAAYSLAEEAAGAEGDDRGTRLFRVCAWNAFALQTIAETLIDVDASDDPGTAGYVPRSTLQFASDCVDRVPDWIRLARIVQTDPEARRVFVLHAGELSLFFWKHMLKENEVLFPMAERTGGGTAGLLRGEDGGAQKVLEEYRVLLEQLEKAAADWPSAAA